MPYQNNNERITPDAVINRKINPVATPVDKLIRYTPDTSKSTEFSNIAESLAALGQGLDTLDERFQKAAADDALSAYENTEGEENKKQWAEVSKNVQGMAKFNPYVKDEYKKLVADDIVKKAVLDLNSDPNFYKADEATFTQRVSNVQTSVLSEFKETGLEAKDYADSLEKFRKSMTEHTLNYVKKNNEYNYNLSLNKEAFDYGHTVSTGLYGVTDEDTKKGTILAITNANVERLTTLGIPKDDICKIISSGLVDYILRDPESVNEEALKAALNEVTIQGSKLGELDPELEYKLHKLITSAKREKREQANQEWQDRKREIEQKKYSAMEEFFTYLSKNKNASDKECEAKGWELIKSYGLEGEASNMLRDIISTRSALTQLRSIKSDPETFQNLSAKAALDELSRQDIYDAINDGALNGKDALSLMTLLKKEEEKEQKAETKQIEEAGKSLLNLSLKRIKNKTTNKKDWESIRDNMLSYTNKYKNGEITLKEYNNYIHALNQRAEHLEIDKSTYNSDILIRRDFVNLLPIKTEDTSTAIEAFKKAKIFGNRQVEISSTPEELRDRADGTKKPHQSWDVKDAEGEELYSPKEGILLNAGYEESMGNYALFRFYDGTYMRCLHLQNNISKFQGRAFKKGSKFGNVGNTGNSRGSHTDIRFFDSSFQNMTPTSFARNIR